MIEWLAMALIGINIWALLVFWVQVEDMKSRTESAEFEAGTRRAEARTWKAMYNSIAPHRTPLTPEELERRSDKIVEVLDKHDLI